MPQESEFPSALEAALELEEVQALLKQAYRDLAKAKNRTAALSEATFQGARAALMAHGKPKIIPAPSFGSKGKAEVALLHMTDWQGSKVTTTYNSEIMKLRVRAYIQRVLKLVEIQRKDHPVNDVVALFTGDMVEGLFQYAAQLSQIDETIYDQYVTVATLISEALLSLAKNFITVLAVGEWGNHGRIGGKRDNVPKGDNFDRMVYRLSEAMVAHEPRITWQQSEEDVQRLVIGNYRALAIHGDEFGRGGSVSPMTIVRFADRWRSGAYRVNMVPWEFKDVYLGHYHTHAEWPMANGEGHIYQTGSIESDNRYAMDTMASTAMPSQRLHFIDPRKGRVTTQYQVDALEI